MRSCTAVLELLQAEGQAEQADKFEKAAFLQHSLVTSQKTDRSTEYNLLMLLGRKNASFFRQRQLAAALCLTSVELLKL
jgi:hypothetical protein